MKHVDYRDLSINPMTLFGERWGVLTGGTQAEGFNGMTIAWGHLGSVWHDKREGRATGPLPTAVCYVRPQRHTRAFTEASDYFTIAFLPEGREFKRAHGVMGGKSGRDLGEAGKFEAAGLTVETHEGTGSVYPAESELVFVCRKLYHADLDEQGFDNRAVMDATYPERDFHRMYVGEIVDVLAAE